MISLCMIVRNEEEYLDNCLKNIRWPISEIIIVDTGSNDNTIPIAKKYTKNVYKRKFNNDFSELRNYCIDLATNQWILVLDADEYMDDNDIDKLNDLLIEMNNNNTYGARLWRYDYYKNGGWAVKAILRFFKKRDDIFYERKINETVSFSIEKLKKSTMYTSLKIHHFGYLKNVEYVQYKHNRYLDMLKTESKNNYSLLYYHAKEYFLKGEFNKALLLSNEAIKIKSKKRLFNLNGDIYFEQKNSKKAAESYNKVIVMEDADSSDCKLYSKYLYPTKFYIHSLNRLAEIDFNEKNYDEAIKNLKKILVHCKYHAHIYLNLALIYEKLEMYSEALEYFNKAILINPYIKNISFEKKIDIHETHTFKCFKGINYHISKCQNNQ